MQVVPRDVCAALERWARAYKGYENADTKGEPQAAAELVMASQALAAAWDDMRTPPDQRSDVERFLAEGGDKGA